MDHVRSESERTPEIEKKRALKANKACIPCRARKTKCDAAAIGLPCSGCTSRQCTRDCILPIRQGRTRKANNASPIPSNVRPTQSSIENRLDGERSIQKEPDLFYLNILHEAGEKTTESGQTHQHSRTTQHSAPQTGFTPRNYLSKLPHLDEIDNEYLVKKGAFNLPPPYSLDAIIKTYFDHVHPFAPVLDRLEFIRSYQSGDCSLFLLYAMLTLSCIHAPAHVISACGFESRSAAQDAFFSKTKLLHDFASEEDPLSNLQGSIILCMIILDRPTDRDFGYWLHNAIRLATKLDVRTACIREDRPQNILRLYRRIWWAIYSLDIFYVSVNTKRSRLLEDTLSIKPRTEEDGEGEDIPRESPSLLSPVTPQQRALPVAQCQLSRIFGQCMSNLSVQSQQNPEKIFRSLDAWRNSLPEMMHVGNSSGTDIYFLSMQAMSYRFECILCRLIRRLWEGSQNLDWGEWAKKRLRSAIFELDTITKRVLSSGTLLCFPISFISTIIALLALHIETALDPTETDLVHSMALISISQTMLVLIEGKEIPALKRALPLFEDIVAKKRLFLVPSTVGEGSTQLQSESDRLTDVYTLPHTQIGTAPSQIEQWEDDPMIYGDYLGFDFLDQWQIGQLDITRLR